jgi:phosphatidylserine/phosphatidylglycerophosphate/cardiolipin synthase-like enzyme
VKQKFFILSGAFIVFVALGLATSNSFLSHYGRAVQQAAVAEQGGTVAPLELHATSPEYFSLVTEPDDGIEPVLSRIEHAQKSIDLVMYAMSDQHVEAALKAAVARGVSVRVLLNGGYYSQHEQQNEAMYERLQTEGVPVHWTPTSFALTHQKTLVVDGTDALVMTFNLQPKYYKTGRDFAVDDTDPNDVAAIEQTFEADWKGSEIEMSSGDDLLWSPGAKDETLYLINSASSTLDIYNEEMNDVVVEAALTAAAKRGVNVRVDMTYATNWKPEFTNLTNGGVHVRTYASSSKKIYIHAKVIIVNGTTAFVGSQNFSNNSLEKNRELGIVLSAPAVISGLQHTFDTDWAGARPFVVAQ